jgi:hypothetical protein
VIGTGLFLLLAFGYFLTPTYDDGFNVYMIKNTMSWGTPFYSNYLKMRFPTLKLSTALFAVIFTYLIPLSFKLAAFVQSLLMLTSSILVYRITKYYKKIHVARLTAVLFMYLIFSHYWISPTRPELWLINVILIVILLSELYLKTKRIKYLVIGAIITGCIGITFHTNASILYIYIMLFVLYHKKLFSKSDYIMVGFSLLVSSAVGLVIIFLPDPSEAWEFFIMYSTEGGNRFVILKNELNRFRTLYSYPFFKYIFTYFTLLIFVYLYQKRKILISFIRSAFVNYTNPLIYVLSVIIGLGILPSANWGVYIIYYFFPITLIFSAVFFSISLPKKYAIGLASVFVFLVLKFIYSRLYGILLFDAESIYKLVIFYPCIIILCMLTFHDRIKRIAIYSVLCLWMFFKVYMLSLNHNVYQEVHEIFKSYPNDPIIATAEFNWIDRSNTNYFIAPFLRNSNPSAYNKGLIIYGETEASRAYPVKTFLKYCSDCYFEFVGEISSSFNPFVGNKFRGLKVYRYSGFDVINSPFH